MRIRLSRDVAVALVLAGVWGITTSTAFAAKRPKLAKPTKFGRPVEELKEAEEIDGRELFERQWQVGDERSHGGDGLGPMFNEKSCAACHKDGGVGGSGPRANNALILSPLVRVPVGAAQGMMA